MGAPELHWQIARSKLPPFLKLTMYTLALVADARHGFANIYFAKTTIGRLSSRSERIAREDVADLVTYGVLLVVGASKGGKPSTYQIVWDRLASWTDEDTQKLAQTRRLRRERYPENTKTKPGSVQPGSRRRKPKGNPDPYSRGSRIRTAEKPGSVQPRSTQGTDPSESTAGDGDRPPVDAVENQLADADSLLDREPRASGSAFRLLADAGRRLLAGEQSGEFPASELRAELRRVALRCGFASELADSVERFLYVQHQHHTANAGGAPGNDRGAGKGVPAAPPSKSSVRRPGEVAP